MRIIVNDIAASYGGALSILQQFYNFIKENDHENEWIFLLSEKHFEETKNIKIILMPQIKQSALAKLKFDLLTGRAFLDRLRPDVILSLQNIITFGASAAQIAYIHQSLPYQSTKSFSFFKKNERVSAVYQHLIGRIITLSAKKANAVAVQTQWMKRALAKKASIPQDKIITVFPNAKNYKADNSRHNCRCFFYPTNNETYKNIDTIISACDILRGLGICDFEVRLTLEPDSYTHPNIKCIGYQNDEGMQKNYNECSLLFASYIETVGLPLIEARSANSVILASDTSFAAEALEGYSNAYFFNPFDKMQLSALMQDCIEGKITPRPASIAQLPQGWNCLYDLILELGNQKP